jgi:hypothetical protein
MTGFVPALAKAAGILTNAFETVGVAGITDAGFGNNADCGSDKSEEDVEEEFHVLRLGKLRAEDSLLYTSSIPL